MTGKRWGSFTWGDGTIWGAGGAVNEAGSVIWVLNVDWDNDGVYDGDTDYQYIRNVQVTRGKQHHFLEGGSGFDHVRPGEAVITLDNFDRRYDPRNSSSPLYGNLLPGRKAQLSIKYLPTNTTYLLLTGKIDDIRPTPEGRNVAGTADIKLLGNLQHLNDQVLTSGSVFTNTDLTGALWNALLDSGYPGGISLDEDDQPITVFQVDNDNAATVVHQIADAGLGNFFVDAAGRARFYSRSHNTQTTHTIDESDCLTSVITNQPWEGIYNDVTIVAHRRIKLWPKSVWFLTDPVAIDTGASVDIIVSYPPTVNFTVIQLEANSAYNGEGTDLSADFTVDISDLSFVGGTISVTNSSGTNGFLISLAVRGQELSDLATDYRVGDATSQGKFGSRRLIIDSPYLQDRNYANSFATIVKNFTKDERPNIELEIEGRPDIQYAFELYDKVDFTSAALDLNSTWYIIGIDHKWNSLTGQGVVTKLYLDQIIFNDTNITPASEEVQGAPPPGDDGGWDDPLPDPDPGYDEPYDPTLDPDDPGYGDLPGSGNISGIFYLAEQSRPPTYDSTGFYVVFENGYYNCIDPGDTLWLDNSNDNKARILIGNYPGVWLINLDVEMGVLGGSDTNCTVKAGVYAFDASNNVIGGDLTAQIDFATIAASSAVNVNHTEIYSTTLVNPTATHVDHVRVVLIYSSTSGRWQPTRTEIKGFRISKTPLNQRTY